MSAPYYSDESVTLYHGDCREVLAEMPDNSVDAIVTDPPYGLGFMGKEWDSLPPGEPWARECLRVLKPGGHMLAFGGSRTWHRLAVAVEDAGFEVRDSIAWLYGSGFPKSHSVSKHIDRMAGAERPRTKEQGTGKGANAWKVENGGQANHWIADAKARGEKTVLVASDDPITDDASKWQGWGTALKPAFEPVVVARKPLEGTVAANVLAHGTGALNIDGARIDASAHPVTTAGGRQHTDLGYHGGAAADGSFATVAHPSGRWPANVILDESQAAALDEQSGYSKSPASTGRGASSKRSSMEGGVLGAQGRVRAPGDSGGASRFFYVAKAPKSERPVVDGTAHPTVKPLALMRYLVKLVTPPGGVVLDTFAGSGATLEAARLEGFNCIGIEQEERYLPLVTHRIERVAQGVLDFGDAS